MSILPTCHEVQSLATEYREGALPWHRALGVRIHLLLCWACRAFVRGLEALPRLVGKSLAPGPDVPPGAVEALEGALKKLRKGDENTSHSPS